jgi:hypothetical protein
MDKAAKQDVRELVLKLGDRGMCEGVWGSLGKGRMGEGKGAKEGSRLAIGRESNGHTHPPSHVFLFFTSRNCSDMSAPDRTQDQFNKEI